MKSSSNRFDGFPAEMLSFLFELKETNTISNQAENLVKYKEYISAPLTALYETLLRTIWELDLFVETKLSRCVSTPYTDRRFSPQAPLKEYMYIRFKQSGKETDIPGLYFDLGTGHYGYGIRIYKQTSGGMDKLREQIVKKPQIYSSALTALYEAGFTVIGEKYKKDHFPEIQECLAKEILNRRGFYIEKAVPVGSQVFSPALADELAAAYRKLADFYKLLEKT